MDRAPVSEAGNPGSNPGEGTIMLCKSLIYKDCIKVGEIADRLQTN